MTIPAVAAGPASKENEMDNAEAVLREAETYLRSFTRSDLIYRDSVTIGGSLDGDEYVCVATYGAADELGKNDPPEEWPIRLEVHDVDGNEAGAYLSLAEADELCRAIRAAMRRARRYPQPGEISLAGDGPGGATGSAESPGPNPESDR